MNQRLFKIQNRDELEICYSVMKELRPNLVKEDFYSIYDISKVRDNYEIVAIEIDEKIVALMGYRFLYDYVRGKHLYIDDLVSTQLARGKGLGAELLKHAEKVARDAGCKVLRLCTGVENEDGVRFYKNNGWSLRAHAFTKNLD